jgi:hypothetical protein
MRDRDRYEDTFRRYREKMAGTERQNSLDFVELLTGTVSRRAAMRGLHSGSCKDGNG